MDSVKYVGQKANVAAGVLKSAHQLYTGPVGTALKNMLPNADENGRPSFAGETHAILRLPNGKYGTANYMGPNTNLVARLKRKDPPRTASDRVAMAHDIRYSLARSQKEVVGADEKMVAKLKDILAKREDNAFNVNVGMRPIQAKMLGEKFGVIKHGAIASHGGVNDPADRALLSGKLAELEQEGYGMLPGELLKRKLMKRHGKHDMRGGKGLNLQTILPHVASFLAKHVMPLMVKHLGGGSLKLAGQWINVRASLHMAMLKKLNDGANRDGRIVLGTDSTNIRGRGYKQIFTKMTPYAKEAGKILLPILLRQLQKQMGMGGNGCSPVARRHMRRHLNKAMAHFIAHRGNRKAMAGGSFWKDFGHGFMSVMKPALKILPAVLPLLL